MEIRNRQKQLGRKQRKLEETKELGGENQKESIERKSQYSISQNNHPKPNQNKIHRYL